MDTVVTRIFIQFIFPVKTKKVLIPQEKLEEVFECIESIISSKGQNPIIVRGTTNHIHAFLELMPNVTLSTLIRAIRNESAKFINQQKWLEDKFYWHGDWAAFSYGSSQVGKVYEYIKNQSEHHKTVTFLEEFVAYLTKCNVEYDEKDLPPDFEKGSEAGS